ncbi:nucleoside 2-deoxyribosyltransferase [Falsibacillus pallidus]|uniref:Nucleoside 2-deoxyribosyltransferase-like protein n=1 Tax=Falsibacillus pallidus TaxID=493781 RepID=A0A370G5L8_9BACI|nr:nucleoside 2-deoxyribosyltransferase [Falsibacillus pallidus]RDI39121.1 hypothetical protein DFR59_11528 [Falsibacillus pallidus]
MKKFYVASSFRNIEQVRSISGQLKNKGYVQTYDWTDNSRASTIKDLRDIGEKERIAVKDADFIIVLLPAGKGSHIELGIALGQGKPIFLHSPDDKVMNFETTSTFYHVSGVEIVIGTTDRLFEKLEEENYI